MYVATTSSFRLHRAASRVLSSSLKISSPRTYSLTARSSLLVRRPQVSSFVSGPRRFASDAAPENEFAEEAANSVDGGQEHQSGAAPAWNRGSTPPGKSVYIGNLFFSVTEPDLKKEFEKFGDVVGCKVIYDHKGLSKGMGFVEFEDTEGAQRAIQELNGEMFHGRLATVQYASQQKQNRTRPPRSNPPARTLFIGNMSFEMTDKDLNDLFKEIKNVVDVRVAIDRRTGQPRGFAHADFVDIASAEAAVGELSGREFYGRRLRVDFGLPSTQGGGNVSERAQPAQPETTGTEGAGP
ncbi:MAG: hypothetical protein M1833_001592 [Piccolia ochrophora]|nr:MAG: hypothetical protein M1833_001592 [Piccolia ochrophora]